MALIWFMPNRRPNPHGTCHPRAAQRLNAAGFIGSAASVQVTFRNMADTGGTNVTVQTNST